MAPMTPRRLVVKIGSNVLTCADGTLDLSRMESLVEQIANLRQQGHEIILVSSGAVASGRSILPASERKKKLAAVSMRQLYSAVGQARLINEYYQLFSRHGLYCGQVLTTKESFSTRQHYLNQQHCMEVMLAHDVLPIVNENDTISVTELMFTDNDELSGLVASMMKAQQLIILSNIDGIYNGDPQSPDSQVIRRIDDQQEGIQQYFSQVRSSFGRGGIITKHRIARQVAAEGIEVIIANGQRAGILLDLLASPDETLCTRFTPSEKSITPRKKWLAHSEGFAKGELHLSPPACAALTGESACSLLSVGVTRVEGDFEKGDIVRLLNAGGALIALGQISCDASHARRIAGEKDHPALVHYDYLHLISS